MGWTYSHRPSYQSVADWLRQQLPQTHETAERVSIVGNVVHLVSVCDAEKVSEYCRTVYRPCLDGRFRQLLVILIGHDSSDHYNTGYKDMTEGMGPSEAVCPVSLLDMLSPLTDHENAKYARDYRERCRAHHARKSKTAKAMKPGATIVFNSPLRFGDGYTGNTFKVERARIGRGRRESTVFRAPDNGKLYRITGFGKLDWQAAPAAG